MKTQKYRVTQIKRHHLAYIFACKRMNLKKTLYVFDTYKLHKTTNETVFSRPYQIYYIVFGRIEVMSTTASHSPLNISETVRGLFQRTTNKKWPMGYQMVT